MVDLTPLFKIFAEQAGYGRDLSYTPREDDTVSISTTCNGGAISGQIHVDFGDSGKCSSLEIWLWPLNGKTELFDLSHLNGNGYHDIAIQDELGLCIMSMEGQSEGKRCPAFRRSELLDPQLEFEDQDLERLVVVFVEMLKEVEGLFPLLVALKQGKEDIYGKMLKTEEVMSTTIQ